jgi:hypothetical protein
VITNKQTGEICVYQNQESTFATAGIQRPNQRINAREIGSKT